MGMKTDISSADGMMEDGNHLFWIHPWETKRDYWRCMKSKKKP